MVRIWGLGDGVEVGVRDRWWVDGGSWAKACRYHRLKGSLIGSGLRGEPVSSCEGVIG